MTDLDELIREVLSTDAQTQLQPDGLTERSMQLGRRLRQRRRFAFASAALGSVAALVAGSLAISDAVTRSSNQVVAPAGQLGHRDLHPVGPWRSWARDRAYGTKLSEQSLTDVPASQLLAGGTMTDGIQFKIYATDQNAMPVSDIFGFSDQPIFGDNPGEGSPQYRPDAPYFAIEAMTATTWDHGNEDQGTGQWLIVAAQPGTTSASYSADGTTWQPMLLQNGIAVLQLPAIAPRGAQLELSDAQGPYVDGPLAIL